MPSATAPAKLSRFGSNPVVRGHIVGILVFSILQALIVRFPAALFDFFISPAAHIAAFFLGAPVLDEPERPLFIPLAGLHTSITEACSGFGFFSFLTAILLGFFVSKVAVTNFRTLPVVVLGLIALAYIASITINGFRIVCVIHARRLIAPLLPNSLESILHSLVGLAVFVSALSFLWILTLRLYDSKQTNRT